MALGGWLIDKAKVLGEQARATAGDLAKDLAEKARSAAADLATEKANFATNLARERDTLRAIDARFSPYRFPRIPSSFLKVVGDIPNMREDIETWRAILDEWPHPPRDEPDRIAREAIYWQRETDNNLVVGRAGPPALRARQEILDRWWLYEKWNFRRYYAATGIVHPSVFSETLIRLSDGIEESKIDIFTFKDDVGPKKARTAAAAAEWNQFWNVTVPDHREKWGNWYLFHIEQDFSKRGAAPERVFDRPSDDL